MARQDSTPNRAPAPTAPPIPIDGTHQLSSFPDWRDLLELTDNDLVQLLAGFTLQATGLQVRRKGANAPMQNLDQLARWSALNSDASHVARFARALLVWLVEQPHFTDGVYVDDLHAFLHAEFIDKRAGDRDRAPDSQQLQLGDERLTATCNDCGAVIECETAAARDALHAGTVSCPKCGSTEVCAGPCCTAPQLELEMAVLGKMVQLGVTEAHELRRKDGTVQWPVDRVDMPAVYAISRDQVTCDNCAQPMKAHPIEFTRAGKRAVCILPLPPITGGHR